MDRDQFLLHISLVITPHPLTIYEHEMTIGVPHSLTRTNTHPERNHVSFEPLPSIRTLTSARLLSRFGSCRFPR